MNQSLRSTILLLLVGFSFCAGLTSKAHAGPALYTGFIQLHLWEREVPYGAFASHPEIDNLPLGGSVSLFGTGPASFSLPAGTLNLTTSAFDLTPPVTTLDFRSTMFAAYNGAGSFYGSAASAMSVFAPIPSIPASQFGVAFGGAPNRFGGVMKILGSFDWRGEQANCIGCSYRTIIPLSPIGGPFGGTAMAMTYAGGTAAPPTFVTATVWGFPWETGTVYGIANVSGTYTASTTTAIGADLRSPSGLGTLQLVTPFVVRVKSHPPDCGGCENRWYYAGNASMELRFVPEPGVSASLAVGLGTLAALYRFRNRRMR